MKQCITSAIKITLFNTLIFMCVCLDEATENPPVLHPAVC
jgi:hypothetical protein